MKFWTWLKNLFSSQKNVSAPVSTTPTKPVTAPPVKGWQPAWAQYLRGVFALNLETFSKAVDITTIRPDFFSLTREEKIEVLVTFVRGMCYYESGFNPNSSSVDVGTPKDKDTHSVGLLQMSVVDQANYGFKFGYSYDDLKDPIKNLKLAMAILQRQVERKGRIILRKGVDTGVYWAVIYIGGKYDKSKDIIAGVKALKFGNLTPVETPPVVTSDIPWYDIAEKELGVTERGNGKRVTEYHASTTMGSAPPSTAWCASFVTWALKKAGYKNTNGAWARSYLDIGTKLTQPKKGCIIVFERNGKGGDSHVAFWTGKETATSYTMLGGNQDNMVKIKNYAKKDVLGFRWPTK